MSGTKFKCQEVYARRRVFHPPGPGRPQGGLPRKVTSGRRVARRHPSQLRSSRQHPRRCPQQGPSENESVRDESFRSATRPRPSLPCRAGALECRAAARTDRSPLFTALWLNACQSPSMGVPTGTPSRVQALGEKVADVALRMSDQPPFLSTGPWLGWWVERLLKSLHGGSYWDPPRGCRLWGRKWLTLP